MEEIKTHDNNNEDNDASRAANDTQQLKSASSNAVWPHTRHGRGHDSAESGCTLQRVVSAGGASCSGVGVARPARLRAESRHAPSDETAPSNRASLAPLLGGQFAGGGHQIGAAKFGARIRKRGGKPARRPANEVFSSQTQLTWTLLEWLGGAREAVRVIRVERGGRVELAAAGQPHSGCVAVLEVVGR